VKTTCAASLAALLLLGSASARADIDGFAPQSETVTSRVHLIHRPGETDEGNSVVIEQSKGLVVVDAGGAPAGRGIVREIRKISRKPVRYLIYTHDHGDHNFSAGAFLKAWPHLTIISTDVTSDDMGGTPMDYLKTYSRDYAGEIDFAKQQLERADLLPEVRAGWQQLVDAGKNIVNRYQNMKTYLATLTFSDRLSIPDDETPVEVLYLEQADTNGGVVVWAPTEKVLYTGDILVEPLPAAAPNPASWIQVLDRVAAYDFAYLIPGHGEVQKDRAYLNKTKATLAKVIDEVTPLAKRGVTLADSYKQTDFKSLTEGLSRISHTGQSIVRGTS
jgi:glyoxylase-like metal-dependent hydrolase (beta-lactamase superfamily II)